MRDGPCRHGVRCRLPLQVRRGIPLFAAALGEVVLQANRYSAFKGTTFEKISKVVPLNAE